MRIFLFVIKLSLFPLICFSQINSGSINGSFSTNMQSYNDDASIGAVAADEIILNNAFLNVIYNKDNFSAGIRYESYLNALLGYDSEYKGNGIPYRFVRYTINGLDITAGSYYEQFGSGIVFRTYEDKGLGVDNAMDGIRLKYMPISGLYLKSFIGKSRAYFEYSDGIIRGLDAEIMLNEAFQIEDDGSYVIGLNIVSRFQQDNNPKFILPENVANMSGRINIIKSGFNYFGEYAYKINDPIGSFSIDGNNYAPGRALVNNLSYSQRGFGINFESHWIDNMEFRSERAKEKEFIINYIPTLSKQHSYTLLSLYPCATQSDGEFGFQTDIFYKFKKGSKLGGKYGTKINFNFSKINGIQGGTSFLNDSSETISPLLSFDNENLYFSDFNIEINKKINKTLSMNFVLSKQKYNKDILEGKTIGEYGIINSIIGVADIRYKIKKGHTIRFELQELIEKEDENALYHADGDWRMFLAEYTISPNWFFSIQDMYNWGNHYEDQRLHYINTSIGYIQGANRFEIGYGKKRAGIFCVGGVCREVPSSNGFSLNISSSF